MSGLDDWVWLIFVGIWLLTRLLPRLFKKGEQPAVEPRPAAQRSRKAASPPPAAQPRTLTQRMPAPEGRSETLRRIRSAKPIEPR